MEFEFHVVMLCFLNLSWWFKVLESPPKKQLALQKTHILVSFQNANIRFICDNNELVANVKLLTIYDVQLKFEEF